MVFEAHLYLSTCIINLVSILFEVDMVFEVGTTSGNSLLNRSFNPI